MDTPSKGRELPPILRALDGLRRRGSELVELPYGEHVEQPDGSTELTDEIPFRDTPAYRPEIERAWERGFEPERFAEFGAQVDADRCRRCGGAKVVPRWVLDYVDTGDDRLPRYGDVAGQSKVRCPVCAASAKGKLPVAPTGESCHACYGDGIVPHWAVMAIKTSGGDDWIGSELNKAINWDPEPCIVCGGWGRLSGPILQPSSAPRAKEPSIGAHSMATNSFRRNGDFWEIVYEGRQLPLVKAMKGLTYIATILAHPSKHFAPIDLDRVLRQRPATGDVAAETEAAVEGEQGGSDGEDYRAVLTGRTQKEYMTALKVLKEQLETQTNPEERLEIEDKIKAVTTQLNQGRGLGGKEKHFADETVRARTSVGNAIDRALEKLERHDKALVQELRRSIKETGGYGYRGSVVWEVGL